MHECVGRQPGFFDDREESPAFKIFGVKGERDSSGRVVRVFQNVMASGDVAYKESCPP